MITVRSVYGIVYTFLALVAGVLLWDAYGHDDRLECIFYTVFLIFFAAMALDFSIPDRELPDDDEE
jgi:hypothetical protein